MNCEEEFITYLRARIRRRKINEAIFGLTVGVIFGVFLVVGLTR